MATRRMETAHGKNRCRSRLNQSQIWSDIRRRGRSHHVPWVTWRILRLPQTCRSLASSSVSDICGVTSPCWIGSRMRCLRSYSTRRNDLTFIHTTFASTNTHSRMMSWPATTSTVIGLSGRFSLLGKTSCGGSGWPAEVPFSAGSTYKWTLELHPEGHSWSGTNPQFDVAWTFTGLLRVLISDHAVIFTGMVRLHHGDLHSGSCWQVVRVHWKVFAEHETASFYTGHSRAFIAQTSIGIWVALHEADLRRSGNNVW